MQNQASRLRDDGVEKSRLLRPEANEIKALNIKNRMNVAGRLPENTGQIRNIGIKTEKKRCWQKDLMLKILKRRSFKVYYKQEQANERLLGHSASNPPPQKKDTII